MKRLAIMALHACLLSMLSGCYYFSYWKTNTTTAPMHQQTSAETVCKAMGADMGKNPLYSFDTLDQCVRREELDRGHNEFGF